MTVKHDVVHTFAAGLNASTIPVPMLFDHPIQQGWKVYYDGMNDSCVRTDDAYWLVQANGGGTIGAGDSNSIRITPDSSVYSGYSFYRTLADRTLTAEGKHFYMETRVKMTLESGGTVPANGWFVGYTDAAEAMTTGANDAMDKANEYIGFGQVDADTAISFYSIEDTVEQAISLGTPLVSGTYVKLACYFDGINFNLYRDDQLVSSTAFTSLNVDEGMTPQVYMEAVEDKANTFDVQYLLLAVEI